MIFLCPLCKGYAQKKHYCIFLFDKQGMDPNIRPLGRFVPSVEPLQLIGTKFEPKEFSQLSLFMWDGTHDNLNEELIPGDLKCKWRGTLKDGVVSWKPSLFQRIFR